MWSYKNEKESNGNDGGRMKWLGENGDTCRNKKNILLGQNQVFLLTRKVSIGDE